jgi:hypothetical protein
LSELRLQFFKLLLLDWDSHDLLRRNPASKIDSNYSQRQQQEDPAVMPRPLFSRLAMAIGFVALIAVGGAHAQSAGSLFSELDGSWSGRGSVRFSDGKSEKITCRAYYNPKSAGAELGLAIRCASASYKIEIRASLLNQNGRLTGRWEERTFNASGEVTGRASAGKINMDIVGGGLTASMSVSTEGSRQAVSISTEGSNLKGVTIALSRS